jgi:hypothetical protein
VAKRLIGARVEVLHWNPSVRIVGDGFISNYSKHTLQQGPLAQWPERLTLGWPLARLSTRLLNLAWPTFLSNRKIRIRKVPGSTPGQIIVFSSLFFTFGIPKEEQRICDGSSGAKLISELDVPKPACHLPEPHMPHAGSETLTP